MKTKKVIYLSVHNSCRSQIAECLTNLLSDGTIEGYSAGTQIAKEINPTAVRIMKEIYNVDMTKIQFPKLIQDAPKSDYVITMGCNVQCPILPYDAKEISWNFDDPTGKSDEFFKEIIQGIEIKVKELIDDVKENSDEK